MKKNIINFFLYYFITLIVLELYTILYSIGYFKTYSLFNNSIIEFITIFLIYSIFYLFSKRKLIFVPFIFLIAYISIDIISENYSRYIDYSDLENIPLLFNALLQSKGDILYLIFLLPIILLFLIIRVKTIRGYFLAIFSIIFIFTIPLTKEAILSKPFIILYNQLAYSHKNFWSPNILVFDYPKIGRLSTFFYEGMIKHRRENSAKLYLGNSKKELLEKVNILKNHLKHRNIYLIGLESFSVPQDLTNLKLKYLNHDKNISYDVIKNSSTMITSIFGGGTIQSEFEALCGEPALQKFSAFEFTELTGSPTNCLPRLLSNLGYKTLVTNSFEPQPSFQALTSLGFKDINFPKSRFPKKQSYLSNKKKLKNEYAIFDTNLYQQNQAYIKSKYFNKNQYVFDYMFSVWGHAFHEMSLSTRPKAIEVENKKDISISKQAIRAINQSYYRIKALQKYFDNIKKSDPNALVIAFADHRPVLDGATSYKKFGLKYKSVFHNFIIIMDRGKYIKFKKPFPLYALPDIILNRLTDGWYCKNSRCKIGTSIKDRERYLKEYYKIMSNGMRK